MKKRFVITSTPIKFPIQSTILYSFLLYYFKVDNIWWGIFIALYSLLWILAIVGKIYEEGVDINTEISEKKSAVKSRFMERLNQELAKK